MRETDADRVWELIRRISKAYPDDPGTSDLYDEQPAYSILTLGDVRLCQRVLRKLNFVIGEELCRPRLETYNLNTDFSGKSDA